MADISEIAIRQATADDVPVVCDFLVPFTARKEILARNPNEMLARIGSFLLAVDENGKLAGTVALRDFEDGLMEIRTLTVAQELHGQRLGTRLVQAVIDFARKQGATRIFTLTMRPNLFLRLGFKVTDIADFPKKVKFDCQACPKRMQCDEIALVLE